MLKELAVQYYSHVKSKQKHTSVKKHAETNSKSRFQNSEIFINVMRPVQAFSFKVVCNMIPEPFSLFYL